MADEPSLGELGRLIQALRTDFREDLAGLKSDIGRMVSLDVYAVEKAGMTKELGDLRAEVSALRTQRNADVEAQRVQRAKDVDRVTATRRWMVASVLIPLLGIVLPLALMMKGSG